MDETERQQQRINAMGRVECINRVLDIVTHLTNDIENEPDTDTRISMEDDLVALQKMYQFYVVHS